MDIDTVEKDLKECLMDAKNRNENIPQFISTIAGSNEIKDILETMNQIMDCKNKMEKRETDGKTDDEKD